MATTFYSVTLDGVTNFTDVQGNPIAWSGGFLEFVPFGEGNGNDLDATIDLSGSNWNIGTLTLWSANGGIARINDSGSGSDRSIGFLGLGFDSEVSLDVTQVDVIDGNSAAAFYDITLGAAGARYIDLRADVNDVETGSGFVDYIRTSGVDTVHIYGGARMVDTGGQNDTVGLFGGFTEAVNTGDGNDIFGTVGGDGRSVSMGNGADTAYLLQNFMQFVSMGNGNDKVIANGGGAGLVRLDDGNDTVVVKGGSQLNSVDAGDGNATVTVEAGSRIDNLNVRNGTHVLTTQGDGRINEVFGNDSTLTLTTGSGYTNQINFWRSDTDISIGTGGAGVIDLFSDQAQSHEITSSGWIKSIDMGDGQSMDLTLSGQGGGRITLGDLADTVLIQNGAGVDFISTRAGNDNVQILNGSYVATLTVREGSDTVLIDDSDSDLVRLRGGPDNLTVSGNSFVRTINASEGSSTITLSENAFVNAIDGWRANMDVAIGGNAGVSAFTSYSDTSVTQTIVVNGWAGAIQTGDQVKSNITVKGEVGTIRLGGEDDMIDARGGFVTFISAGRGNDTVLGSDGDEIIFGDEGNDVLRGGNGYDEATGGSGADTFLFRIGDDTLIAKDYEDGTDQIAIAGAGAGLTFNALLAFVSQDGNDTVIGAGDQQIRILNFQATDLDSGDVVFV